MAAANKQLIFIIFDLAHIAWAEVGGQIQACWQVQISTLDNFIKSTHEIEKILFLIKITPVQRFVPAVQIIFKYKLFQLTWHIGF